MTNPSNIVRVSSRNNGRASVYEGNSNMSMQPYSQGLLSGNGVKQNTSADMNVLVGGSPSNPDIVIATAPSGYKIVLDIVGQQAIQVTAPASNSRITSVVAYTDDLSVQSTQTNVTGSPLSCGLILVNGASGASPTAPSDSDIRAAITSDGATGSQAAYVVIANITVASSTNTITNNLISIQQSRISTSKIDAGTTEGILVIGSNGKIVVVPKPFFAELNNGSGSRSSTNSSTWIPVAGRYSFTNPLTVPVKIQLVGSAMIHMTDSSVISRISLSSTDSSSVTTLIGKNVYHQLGTTWTRWTMNGEVTVPAGATVTLGFSMRIEDTSGKYVEIANATTDSAAGFTPTIQGVPYLG